MPDPTLHAWPVAGIAPLPLPSREFRRPWPGVGAATGGGLAVRVTTGSGLREAWWEPSAEDPAGTPRRLALPAGFEAGEPGAVPGPRPPSGANPDPAAFLVPGGWSRLLSDGDVERGMILDAFPVIVLQRLATGTKPTVRSTHLLAPGDVSAETCRRLSGAIPARVLRRHARGQDEAGLELEGLALPLGIAAALRALDDAPLSDPEDGRAGGPALVGGVSGGRLIHLGPADLVEVALGALASGRWALAARIVDAVLSAGGRMHGAGSGPEATSAARLLLATRWATWTGDVERLRAHGAALDAAARSLASGGEGAPASAPEGGVAGSPAGPAHADLPAAFPSTAALLAEFADAVEPLGDRTWVADLRGLARDAEAASESTGRPADRQVEHGRPVRGVRLPVIGGAAASAGPDPDEAPGPRPALARLPPVEAFASPDHPSVAPRRTVHAARLVRSAIEGLCGVRPDAAWGRVTLAPDLRGLPADESGTRHLMVRGIRVGDVRIDLDCRVSGVGGTLRVSQVSGRVPMNVVFEPCLPLAEVQGVRVGGEPADVEIERLEDGVRLRFQFPLDPERRVSVDGTA